VSRVLVVAVALAAATGPLVGAAGQEAPDAEPGRTVSYDEALALFIQNSHELKLADEDVRDARRRVKTAGRQYHPRLKVQGTARGDLLQADTWSADRNLGAGMVLDWSPYRNGELLRENMSAKVGLIIATLSRRQAAIDLEYDFRRLYYDIINQTDGVHLRKLQRDLEERRLAALEHDLELGRANQSDVLKQKGTFFEADAAWRKSQQSLQLKLIELEERMGRDEVAAAADVDRTIEPAADLDLDDCIAAAQGARISLLTSRQQVRLADLGVKYAALKRLPSVYFFTGSDYALTQEVGPSDFELRAGVTVSYPIYGAGDTAAAIADAKAAAVRARIQDSKTRFNVEREIREAYWAYVNTLALLDSTRERERVFEDALKEAQVMRERGAISDIDFAAAEISHEESRQRVRALELDALMTRAALVKAVGVLSLDDIVRGQERAGSEPPAQKEAQ
jgi:outer membrane protein TolC